MPQEIKNFVWAVIGAAAANVVGYVFILPEAVAQDPFGGALYLYVLVPFLTLFGAAMGAFGSWFIAALKNDRRPKPSAPVAPSPTTPPTPQFTPPLKERTHH